MRQCLKVLLFFVLVSLYACTPGKGTETGNPEPLGNMELTLTTAALTNYSLETDANGSGTFSKSSIDGTVSGSATVSVLITDSAFSISPTLSDGTEIVFNGTVDDDDKILTTSLSVDGSEVETTARVTYLDPTDPDTSSFVVRSKIDMTSLAANVETNPFALAYSGTIYGLVAHNNFVTLDPSTNSHSELMPFVSGTPTISINDIAWNGTDFAIVYGLEEDDNDIIYFTRMDASGTVTVPARQIPSVHTNTDCISIVSGDDEYGLAWCGYSGSNWWSDIYFMTLNADGSEKTAAKNISNSESRSHRLILITTSSSYAATWNEVGDGDLMNIYLKPDISSDTSALLISDTSVYSTTPSLVWDGASMGVTWVVRDDSNIGSLYFARYSPAGAALVERKEIATNRDGAVITWNDTHFTTYSAYAVASGYTGITFHNTYLTKIDQSGRALSSNESLLIQGTVAGDSFVSQENGFALIWQEFSSIDQTFNPYFIQGLVSND